MMPITGPLAGLFPDSVSVRACLTRDAFGKALTFGPSRALRCRIEGQDKKVVSRGVEKVSGIKITFDGYFGLGEDDEYTLPSRYDPRQPIALTVDTIPDENGPHHQIANFGRVK